MTEFEKMLKEYRRLAVQVEDERNYLEHLERQLRGVEKQLKSMSLPAPAQLGPFSPVSRAVEVVLEPTGQDESPSASAIQDAVRAVSEIGDGVTAQQLAEHLNITPDAARLRLQRAAREGLIARMAVGRYREIKRAPEEPKTSIGRGPNDTEGMEEEKDDPAVTGPSNGFVAKVD
jgi:hypothetical protein